MIHRAEAALVRFPDQGIEVHSAWNAMNHMFCLVFATGVSITWRRARPMGSLLSLTLPPYPAVTAQHAIQSKSECIISSYNYGSQASKLPLGIRHRTYVYLLHDPVIVNLNSYLPRRILRNTPVLVLHEDRSQLTWSFSTVVRHWFFKEVTSGLNSLVVQVDQEIDTIKLAINQLVL